MASAAADVSTTTPGFTPDAPTVTAFTSAISAAVFTSSAAATAAVDIYTAGTCTLLMLMIRRLLMPVHILLLRLLRPGC